MVLEGNCSVNKPLDDKTLNEIQAQYWRFKKGAYENFSAVNQKLQAINRSSKHEAYIDYLQEFKRRVDQAYKLFRKILYLDWENDAFRGCHRHWGDWSPFGNSPFDKTQDSLKKMIPLCDYFYWDLARAIKAAKSIPFLENMECQEILTIRNILIEHPGDAKKDASKIGTLPYSISLNPYTGPQIKIGSVKPDGSGHTDEGMYENVILFSRRLNDKISVAEMSGEL